MRQARWLSILLAITTVAAVLGVALVEAKDGPLTFDKIVIASGAGITSPVEITGAADLRGTGLDSIRPSIPAPDDLGTAYRLILYPDNSDATIEVTYYPSKSDDRGYIYQDKSVSLGGGTLGPGWSRPTPELESALRDHGAANAVTQSDGFALDSWKALVPIAAAALILTGGLAARQLRRSGQTRKVRTTSSSQP
jgi:hypothetical protein